MVVAGSHSADSAAAGTATQAEVGQIDLGGRELEIPEALAGGYSNKEIARGLNLAEGTVKNYVSDILAKLARATGRGRTPSNHFATRVVGLSTEQRWGRPCERPSPGRKGGTTYQRTQTE